MTLSVATKAVALTVLKAVLPPVADALAVSPAEPVE